MGTKGCALPGPGDVDRLGCGCGCGCGGRLSLDWLLKGLEEVRPLEMLLLLPLEAPGPRLGCRGSSGPEHWRPITGLEAA